MFQSLIDGIDQHQNQTYNQSYNQSNNQNSSDPPPTMTGQKRALPSEQSNNGTVKRVNVDVSHAEMQSNKPPMIQSTNRAVVPRYLSDQSNHQSNNQSMSPSFRPVNQLMIQAPTQTFESEFRSQLFVIYMPKTNFKRFIITADSINIIRAPKNNQSINQPPRVNYPIRRATSQSQSNSQISSPSLKSGVGSPLISPTMKQSMNQPPTQSLSPSIDDYTYNVSMEDVLSCLDNQSINFNRRFMWVDLVDHGARFVQAMKTDCLIDDQSNDQNDQSNTQSNNQSNDQSNTHSNSQSSHAGLWYNVSSKSHLIAHHLDHPFLGEGYAVVITLDLLDDPTKTQSSNQVSSQSDSQVNNQSYSQSNNQSNTQVKDESTNQSSKESTTESVNQSNNQPNNQIDDEDSHSPSSDSDDDSVNQSNNHSIKSDQIIKNQSSNQSNNQNNPPVKKKIRPVETIGEMLERVVEYQNVRMITKSKNQACQMIGYSKGTINSYREKIKAAVNLQIDLSTLKATKYRDFKRVLIAAQKVQGQTNNQSINQSISQMNSSSAFARAARREEKLRKRSNSFGELGMLISQSLNQSNNQTNNQSNSQSVNQSMTQSMNPSMNQSINQSVNQSQSAKHEQSMNMLNNQPMTPSNNQSSQDDIRLIHVSNNQASKQAINQNQPTYYSTPAIQIVNDRQSINQLNNQSISVLPLAGSILSYQSNNQSINQSINQSNDQQPTHYLAYTTNPSINQSINQTNGSYVLNQTPYQASAFFPASFNQVNHMFKM